MKEKVNTHFSFPLRLDMAPYMEKSLIKKERLQGKKHMISQHRANSAAYWSLLVGNSILAILVENLSYVGEVPSSILVESWTVDIHLPDQTQN